LERLTLRDRVAQLVGRDANSVPCHLHYGFIRGPVIAEHDRKAGKALASDQPDFQPLVLIRRNNGCEPILNKIAVLDRLVRDFENLSKREFDRLEVGFQQHHISV
jgi:hypothetical protein